MMTRNQTCSVPGCDAPAAFKTNKHPTFCDEHIAAIFENAGLELLEPFGKPDDYYLTRCLTCGEELHYRFKYLLDSNGYPTGERACRVCFWRQWYREGDLIGAVNDRQPMTREQAEARATEQNAVLVKILPADIPGEELYITRCCTCGLLQVERYPTNHEKCRPLKKSKVESIPIAPVSSPSRVPAPEKTYPITDNQRLSAREFQPDNHLAFLSDLSWWDFELNDNKQLFALTPSSRKPVHAFCSECGSPFEAPVKDLLSDLTARFVGVCPNCERKRREAWEDRWQRYKTTVIADYPDLLACWDDEESPFTAVIAIHLLRKWKCPEGHHPSQTAVSFIEDGCMVCSSQASKARNAEAARHSRIPYVVPLELRDQWHPTKNAKFEYGKVHISEKRKVWWKCDHCGFEWEESIRDRTRIHEYGTWDAWHEPYCRCPKCGGTLDSLAWHYPSLAAEWSSANPKSAWDIRPNSTTLDFIPQWVCENGHTWSMPLASRVHGSTCPECQEAGKSKVELSYFKAAKKLWPRAAVKSGVILRHEDFSYPWTADILVIAAHSFVIEYDGAYWHADKTETDTRKSRELLSAGYAVIRLREQGLLSLSIDDPSYHEIEVLPTGVDRDAVLAEISAFMSMFLS